MLEHQANEVGGRAVPAGRVFSLGMQPQNQDLRRETAADKEAVPSEPTDAAEHGTAI
jgi:hypothetical protein